MDKIIIDNDGGFDDALAIILAALSNIEVVGITTVKGNVPIEIVNINTFKALSLALKNNIEVYEGEGESLDKTNVLATDVFGDDGLSGNVNSYNNFKVNTQLNAVDYMIEAVNQNPHEITIVALGPCTNIAKAILKNKEFSENIRQLIIMGGSINQGNITEHAEFNFYADTTAADIVLKSNIKNLFLFGWNATIMLPLLKRYEDKLLNISSDIASFFYEGSRKVAEFDRKSGHDGAILSDPLTIAYLINPNVVELKPAFVKIVKDGDLKGKTEFDFESKKTNCKVVTSADSNLFYKILFEKLFNIEID